MGSATVPSLIENTGGISLIDGLMQQYGASGDAIDALRWALPRVLNDLNAEAGSLFLFREEDNSLECVVCIGPVDVTGLVVPADKGLVGRAFTTGEAEIVTDASNDKAHYRAADDSSGFKTVTTATAPVQLGDKSFGSIQAINRKSPEDDQLIVNFTEADLGLLSSLASALAMAISNVQLAEKAINDQILRRDLDQATEAQAALMPTLDLDGYLSGKVIPARQLSGDFFDYCRVGQRIAFCQGDVAGKGITASLMMARCIALFRTMSKQEFGAAEMASRINAELLEVASDRFVTFAVGWFDPVSGDAELVNCGHGPILVSEEAAGATSVIDSHTVPMGLIELDPATITPWQGNLMQTALYMVTDGITESQGEGGEWGFDGLTDAAISHKGYSGSARVADIMRRFTQGVLSTHDDATLLVVTAIGKEAQA